MEQEDYYAFQVIWIYGLFFFILAAAGCMWLWGWISDKFDHEHDQNDEDNESHEPNLH
jgi:hypothetical protein